jgi:hypothetical protein
VFRIGCNLLPKINNLGKRYLRATARNLERGMYSLGLFNTEDHVWFEDRWMVASLCDE